MSDVTHSSMHDARDAEDNRLLENGEIDLLLAGWVETIDARCVAKMRGPVGHDVAQAVCERLWKELKAGKHRDGRWPFRVIVHQVIGYVCAGWYEKGWSEVELIEIDGPADDNFTGDVELQLTLEAFVATLPPADGEVARLWLLEGLEIDEIAERLGKQPNAHLPGPLPHQSASERVARVVNDHARSTARRVRRPLDARRAARGRRAPRPRRPAVRRASGLIDRFLERAPRREPTPDALAFVRSLDDPPLLRARQALGLKLDDLAAALVEQLGLGERRA